MNTFIDLLLQHGVLIVFAVTLAARIGAPVPAAPLLVVAGGLSVGGQLSASAILASALVANVVGDAVWFVSGRLHGQRIMRLLCRISLSPDSCVRQSEALIVRWGGVSLVAAKFVPGVSVVAAPMAGALAMPWRTFLAFEVVAAGLWSIVFLALGLAFHDQIQQVLDAMARIGTAAFVGLLLLVLGALAARRYRRRQRVLRDLDMPRISADELESSLRQGHVPVIVDVRSAAGVAADDRHIPGALHVPLEDIPALAGRLSPRDDVVVYCNCPNDASAAYAARTLASLGIERVRPLAGGLDAWFTAARLAPQEGHADVELATAPHKQALKR